MTHDEILELSFRAMRDEGATAEECIERFGGQEIAEQIRALQSPLEYRRSVAVAASAGERKAAMLRSLGEKREGWLGRLVRSPLRGGALALLALTALGATTAGTANVAGVRDSIGEALGLLEPEGECAGSLSGGENVVCGWGGNGYGQLAAPPSVQFASEPEVIEALAGASQVSAGFQHSLALMNDGSVLAWGDDGAGQLGDGGPVEAAADENQQRLVSEPVEVNLDAVPEGVEVTEVAAGGAFSLALLSDGSVLAWGADDEGQLGNGPELQARSSPTRIEGLEAIAGIAAGFSHVLAVAETGSIYAWGWNYAGQIGNGQVSDNEPAPVLVEGPGPATDVAASVSYSLALLADGTVQAWGAKWAGQLGNGTRANFPEEDEVRDEEAIERRPVAVAGLSSAKSISAGQHHSMALLENGTVWTWGWDGLGQLGNDDESEDQSRPVQVEGLLDVVAIDAGARHSLALLRDGSVRAWGQNDSGELGNGSNGPGPEQPTPVRVEGLRNVAAISAGASFSLALREPTEGDFVAITKGDWVELNADDGCADPSERPPSMQREDNRRLECPPNGTVLQVVGGPVEFEGHRFWALSGFGWFNETYLTFHHEGSAPYPEREELADQGLIAYVGPDRGLWLMNADGSDQHRINRGPIFGTPQWSPDGRLILVAGENRLRIVDIHGAMLLELPGYLPQETLAWSPNNDMVIAAPAQPDGGPPTQNLAVVAVNGSIVLQLESAIDASWSADGTRLGLFLEEGLTPETLGFVVRGALVDVPSGEITPLNEIAEGRYYSEGPPLWRPSHPDQFAYRAQLSNTGPLEGQELPFPIGAWSPDGRYAVMAVQGEEGGTALDYLLYDFEQRDVMLEFTIPSCECDAPDWAAFRGRASFSPDSRYFLLPKAAERGSAEGSLTLLELPGLEEMPLKFESVVGFSPDGEYLVHSSRTVVYPEFQPEGVSSWIWITTDEEENLTMLAQGSNPVWQPVALKEEPFDSPEQAVEAAVRALFPSAEITGECDDQPGFGLCYTRLGTSGSEVGYGLYERSTEGQVRLLFVREEGNGYVVGHLEPAFCQGDPNCPPPAGATVEIVVKETCVNARHEPGRLGPINRCLRAGERYVLTGETEDADGRLWVELMDTGWISASYIRCVEGCGR